MYANIRVDQDHETRRSIRLYRHRSRIVQGRQAKRKPWPSRPSRLPRGAGRPRERQGQRGAAGQRSGRHLSVYCPPLSLPRARAHPLRAHSLASNRDSPRVLPQHTYGFLFACSCAGYTTCKVHELVRKTAPTPTLTCPMRPYRMHPRRTKHTVLYVQYCTVRPRKNLRESIMR